MQINPKKMQDEYETLLQVITKDTLRTMIAEDIYFPRPFAKITKKFARSAKINTARPTVIKQSRKIYFSRHMKGYFCIGTDRKTNMCYIDTKNINSIEADIACEEVCIRCIFCPMISKTIA